MHIRDLIVSVTLSAVFAQPCLTQAQRQPSAGSIPGGQYPPGQPRALALPDTMGANFQIADSAHARGTTFDYEFLVGTWQFTFQMRRADGLWNPVFTGRWSLHKKDVSNALVVDHWRPDLANRSADEGTYTYRAFNPARGLWEIQGVDTDRGRFDGGVSWSDGANRYVVQRSGSAIMRIRYFAITTDHFLWRADRSTDGGNTWLRDAWSMDVRRLPK